MSLEQFIGYILICLMIGIIYLATRVVSSVRYDDEGIYYITINAWFRDNREYLNWLKENTIYHLLILLVVCLVIIVLCLIPPFSRGQMINRPILALFVSVPLWYIIYQTYRWLFKKLKMIE